MKKAYLYTLPLIIVMIIAFSSCEYVYIEPPEVPPVDTTIIISFDTIVVPIFSDQSCTNCHKSGGTSPNLTPDKAFASIVPGLVNLNDPESSTIYIKPHPDGSHYQKYTPVQAQNILVWIEQGAKNN
ncbi:MAG: hypothetical protein J7L04_12270 [Bacteroidales bacterium]|nr:hypothetical protein [Bacteroidales bacterium]